MLLIQGRLLATALLLPISAVLSSSLPRVESCFSLCTRQIRVNIYMLPNIAIHGVSQLSRVGNEWELLGLVDLTYSYQQCFFPGWRCPIRLTIVISGCKPNSFLHRLVTSNLSEAPVSGSRPDTIRVDSRRFLSIWSV